MVYKEKVPEFKDLPIPDGILIMKAIPFESIQPAFTIL